VVLPLIMAMPEYTIRAAKAGTCTGGELTNGTLRWQIVELYDSGSPARDIKVNWHLDYRCQQ